ncbi:Pre-mRNA-splicing factor SPF27 [Xylaria cf. heliscus]|nr:Pre-mRNA-splicing factor SPF27 [Xylaria cf. heliscus]
MTSSIRTTVHESLPYIDAPPTPSEEAAANSLIAAEQLTSPPSSSSTSTSTSTSPSTHPSLPPLTPPRFSPLMTAELARIAASEPLNAIDTSRYEIQELPPSSSTTPSTLQPLLARAYATHTYLQSRETHLRLLDAYGKNAWLVGNWQSEAELAALERELADVKREIDVVNLGRKRLQDEVGEELKGLEETWKKGVGRVLETEIATETLRRKLLEEKRSAA